MQALTLDEKNRWNKKLSFRRSIPVGIASSAVGLKVCAITAGIKKYKPIVKKKRKKHDKIVLLGKGKLDTIWSSNF